MIPTYILSLLYSAFRVNKIWFGMYYRGIINLLMNETISFELSFDILPCKRITNSENYSMAKKWNTAIWKSSMAQHEK